MKQAFLKTCLFLFLSLAVFSCKNQSAEESQSEATEHIEKQGPEYTSVYVCTMHCEGSGSDAAGKCPVCNMDYVALEGHQADGHQHFEGGHDH